MRTTLSLDEDVANSLREQAALDNVSFEQAVNDALRRGLAPAQTEQWLPIKGQRIVSGGLRPGIDPTTLNQLNDELELQEFLAKHRRVIGDHS